MKTVRFLFNDTMARAIVQGRKTVTRRPVISRANGPVINDEHVRDQDGYPDGVERAVFQRGDELMGVAFPCAPGDILIGRECWRFSRGGVAYRASEPHPSLFKGQWCSSTQMAESAARIRRRVVSVTVERLQDITEDDAVREGFATSEELEEFFRNCAPPGSRMARPLDTFEVAWDGIYAAKGLGWDINPWVWRIEFSAENVAG